MKFDELIEKGKERKTKNESERRKRLARKNRLSRFKEIGKW